MLEILFEDEWLLAVDKPAGLVVHPTYKNVAGTLLDELRAARPGADLSVAGRLDKLTSGIVVVAKSPTVHAALQRAWPGAVKEYLAVVEGLVEDDRGEINLPLGTDPADRRRRIVRADGAPSITRFECLARVAGRSVLRCRVVTGRRHQIRVHFAAKGWPIVGDAVYGTAVEGLSRHALHASRLALRHPLSRQPLTIEAKIPADLTRVIDPTVMFRWASKVPVDVE